MLHSVDSLLLFGHKSLSTFLEIAKINGIPAIVQILCRFKMSHFLLVKIQQFFISEYPQTVRAVKCCISTISKSTLRWQPDNGKYIRNFRECPFPKKQRNTLSTYNDGDGVEREYLHLNRQIVSLCLVRSTSFLRIQVPQTHRVCSARCNKS